MRDAVPIPQHGNTISQTCNSVLAAGVSGLEYKDHHDNGCGQHHQPCDNSNQGGQRGQYPAENAQGSALYIDLVGLPRGRMGHPVVEAAPAVIIFGGEPAQPGPVAFPTDRCDRVDQCVGRTHAPAFV
jgi:hypothetical protein